MPLVYIVPTYACFQRSKDCIIDFFEVNNGAIEAAVAQSTSGQHVYVINFVHGQLASDPKHLYEAKEYKNKMNQLKHLRVLSDYHEVDILSDKAN